MMATIHCGTVAAAVIVLAVPLYRCPYDLPMSNVTVVSLAGRAAVLFIWVLADT